MAQQTDINALKSKLEEIFESEESRYGFEFVDFLLGDYDEELANAAKLVWLEQDGGGEGGAEDCETVFSIDDVIYKITYNYYSHHGYETDYAQAYIVIPVQRTITAYE
jgi:hypothetical protein